MCRFGSGHGCLVGTNVRALVIEGKGGAGLLLYKSLQIQIFRIFVREMYCIARLHTGG
jgi:hypothetical protein